MAFEPINQIKPVETATASSNPWVITNTPSYEDTILEVGVYHASIAGFLNLGIQSTEFGMKTQYVAFLAVYKELSEESEIVTLWKAFTPSTSDKSFMYKLVMAANNDIFNNDISKMVGLSVQVMVNQYTNAQGKVCNKIDSVLKPKYKIPSKEAEVPKFYVADIKHFIGNLIIPILTEEEKLKYTANEHKASAPVLQRRSFNDKPIADNPKRVSNIVDNITEQQITDFLGAPSVKADLE